MVLGPWTRAWLLPMALAAALLGLPLLPLGGPADWPRTRLPAPALAPAPASPPADPAATDSDALMARLDRLAAELGETRRRLRSLQTQLVIAGLRDAQEKALYEHVVAAGLSETVAVAIVTAAGVYDVPLSLVMGVITIESNWQPHVRNENYDGSTDYGLMQINDRTVPYLARALELPPEAVLIPEQNVAMGIYYLGHLKAKYGDWHHTLTAYNRGEYGLQQYMRRLGTGESDYSRQVLAAASPMGS